MLKSRSLRCALSLLAAGSGLVAFCAPAQAQDAAAAITIWAAPALFAPDADDCTPDAPTRPSGNRSIDRIFCPMLQPADRARIGQSFAASVRQNFPNVEQQFGDSLPSNASANAKLRHTLAISLRLTRASVASVPKPGSIDAYMPITLTVDVTNIASGEVVFTKTETLVGEGTFRAENLVPELQRQFPAQFNKAMAQLITSAAAQFKPTSQSAQIIDAAIGADRDKLWVLDKGRLAGLRVGDNFGGDGRIVHVGADYAILDTLLDDVKVGHKVSRTVASSASAMARPSVMVVAEVTPPEYSTGWVEQVFEDSLGLLNSLTPMPVNVSFAALRRLALNAADASIAPDSRSLPDYVASVRLMHLDRAHWPSGVRDISVDRYAAHAFITLFDRTGRAVASTHGSASLEDQVSGDMRFSEGQRRDAVVRNALQDAAKKLSSFKPQPISLPVKKTVDGLLIADTLGVVPLGVTLPVLRPIGKVKGGKEDILVPIGSINSVSAEAGGVLASDAGLVPMKFSGRETVAMTVGGEPKASRQAMAQCADRNGLAVVEERKALKMLAWPLAAESIAAEHIKAPIVSVTLAQNLRKFEHSFSEFGKFAPAQPISVSMCFNPILSLQEKESVIQVLAGFTVMQNGTRLTASGLQTNLTPTQLPAGISADSAARLLQQDFVQNILPTARNAAKGINFNPTKK